MCKKFLWVVVLLYSSFSLFGFFTSRQIPYRPRFVLGQALFEPIDESALVELDALAVSENASMSRVTRRLHIYKIRWEPAIDVREYSEAVREGDWQTRKRLHDIAEPEVRRIVRKLENSGLVKWASPNGFHYIMYIPNDPFYPDDGNHTPSSAPDQFDKPLMNCHLAWDRQRGNPNIILAIIDSGTDVDHPDLARNIWINPGEDRDGDGELYDLDDLDGLDNDFNGYIDDLFGYDFVGGVSGEEASPPDQEDWNPDIHYRGNDGWGEPDPSAGNGRGGFPLFGIPPDMGVPHGTHCSGIASAVMDNEFMFAGVAGGGCKIMPVRVGNPEGSMTVSDVAAGIEYAAIAGANVISLSLGSMSTAVEPAESVAIDFAYSRGCVIVCASGNSAGIPWPFGNDSVTYPANASKTIAVGSCTATGQRAPFSQYGSKLDVVAPGGSYSPTTGTITETIWSTWVASVAEADSTGEEPAAHKFSHAEGTSMACPQVTGICGLILSENPSLTNVQVRQILRATTVDLLTPGFDLQTGYGKANAYGAVLAASIAEREFPKNRSLLIAPNPFNTTCKIFSDSNCEVFDITGKSIRRLEIGIDGAVWDGTDCYGNILPNGIYLIKDIFGNSANAILMK